MSFEVGYAYPLMDPESYDDEYGTGYTFALVAEEEFVPEGCYMIDCWIVNERGEKHPGIDSCPVPVLIGDVDAGKKLAMPNNFGRGATSFEFFQQRGQW
jgi:hypothetical protein